MPFVSAFLYESIRYTRQVKPETLPEVRSHQELLRASRMRMKLLDGDPRTLDELLTDADELVTIVKDLFMRDHRGILGPLKRLLQKDVGVHFIQNEVVGTLHVALLNTGLPTSTLYTLSLDALAPYLNERGETIGREAVQVLHELGILRDLDIDAYAAEGAPEHPLSPPQYRDLKSERFYGSIARRTAPNRNGVGVVLTSILSQVNTARVVVPIVAERNEVAAFKIRFVSLFHAALSLQWLLNKDQGNYVLHKDTVQHIKTVLAADAIRSVRKRNSLRNHFFHYDLKENAKRRILPDLVPHLPLYGLVEAHTSGKSLSDIANDVELGLDCISEGLGNLLSQPLTPQGTL
jgi:hypothetical protein